MTEEIGHILTNKPVPEEITQKLEKLNLNEQLQFFIIGDLSKESKYSQSALAITDKGMFCFLLKIILRIPECC